MSDIPEPPSSQQPLTSSAGDHDEASIRLLLDALVKRLKCQPQELAERAVRQGCEAPDRGRP